MTDQMRSESEFAQKQAVIRDLLAEHDLDALLLERVSSFAWATCGASSYINTASSTGVASLLITPSARYVIADNIETPRLEQEEQLAMQGWEFKTHRWYESGAVSDLTRGLRLGADVPHPGARDLSSELSRVRANLTPEEGERFRGLGRLCAEAMDEAIRAVRPGQTEYAIAGLLAVSAEKRGVQAIVNLVATDERISNFRHPLPTARKLERYAMLVLCGRRWGLICSITRLVHFGSLPDELRLKSEAVARVDAAFLGATRPGATIADVFKQAVEAYAREGYPDEWRRHHQGGPAAYEPREFVATPELTDVVRAGQVYAWNPSITGAKSEDTVLIGEQGHEVLSEIPGWPSLAAQAGGREVARPAILEVT
ncbi:MAG TPA: M24 family metallopeptidase [Chloroflexia bacterium]|nr:M24 family metallopeptidase [Chloroflexia bacterium]